MLKKSFNGNSVIYKILTASVLALALMFPLCACSENPVPTQDTRTSEQKESDAIKKNNQKIRDKIKQLLGFDLSDEFIEESEMMLDATGSGSRGNICILVRQGKEESLLSVLEKHFGVEKNISPNQLPDNNKNQYAEELKTMYPIKNWESSGISIYLARKGTYSYLYIFA